MKSKIFLLAFIICMIISRVAGTAEQEKVQIDSNRLTQMVLNKDIVEAPLPQFIPIKICDYNYTGEFPPYRNDAPWYNGFNRLYINNVPRSFHEALFFNDRETFEEFVVRYKDVLKLWASEARSMNLEQPKDIQQFFREKLIKCYENNKEYLIALYPGLTEKQYKLLITMNLVHGNYDFDTQTKKTKNLLELVELEKGDCSELGDLVASLAFLQGVEGDFLGLNCDYQTTLGHFHAGHRIFYAEGLWLDPEINIAFKFNLEEFQKTEPSKRLSALIQQKSILGFYNWYINPEVRTKQLENNQDGGTIAFYYYYYFKGINQGNSSITPYLPKVMLNYSESNKISIAETQSPIIKKDYSRSRNFVLLPGQLAKDYWERELTEALQEYNPIISYNDINSEADLLESLASLIRYYGQQEENDINKLKELSEIAFKEFDQIFAARNVRQGHIKGWGSEVQYDTFLDGSINTKITKYTYQTFQVSLGILDVIDAIKNYTVLPDEYKNKTKKYTDNIKMILNSWEPKYEIVQEGKGFYYFSEDTNDNQVVFYVSGSGISTYLKLFRLTGDPNSIKRAKELAAYLIDYIKVDSSGSYIWPYSMSNQRVDDVNNSMWTSRGIIDSIRYGLLNNFDMCRMERSISSFWNGNPEMPNIYIANSCYTSNEGLSAGINFAQYYELTGSPDYLWEYARSTLVTSLLDGKDLQNNKSLQLKLLGLLFEAQPQIKNNWGELLFLYNKQNITKGERFPELDLTQTSGNARADVVGHSRSLFEIFEGDKITLKIPHEKENEEELNISIIYRSTKDLKAVISDKNGWRCTRVLAGTFDRISGKAYWFRTTIRVDVPKGVNNPVIEISGPVDIYNVECLFEQNIKVN